MFVFSEIETIACGFNSCNGVVHALLYDSHRGICPGETCGKLICNMVIEQMCSHFADSKIGYDMPLFQLNC